MADVPVELRAKGPDLLWGAAHLLWGETEPCEPAEVADQEHDSVGYLPSFSQDDEQGP